MENALSVLPPFLVEEKAGLVKRGGLRGKHHGGRQPLDGVMASLRRRQHRARNVLGNGEHDTVKGLALTLDHDAVLGHRLYRCVEANLGRSETSGELLWNGSNAFTGHHHAAVRHGAPGEISEGQALRERWVKGDTSEERAKDTLR